VRQTYGFVDVQRAFDCGWIPATVYLDGAEVKKCVRLDDRAGWVEAHVLDAEGNSQLNATNDGALVERRYGRVRFVPNTSWEP
jgi:hypothetical protein